MKNVGKPAEPIDIQLMLEIGRGGGRQRQQLT